MGGVFFYGVYQSVTVSSDKFIDKAYHWILVYVTYEVIL